MAVSCPPEKIEAKHYLPPDSKLLVLVHDLPLREDVDTAVVRRNLTNYICAQLDRHDVVANTVPYDDLLDLMIADPQFNEYTPGQVADKLEADTVLYIRITQFALKESKINPLWQGQLETKVKVIDLNDDTLWPDDRPTGYPVKPSQIRTTNEASPAYATKLTNLLCAAMADDVAKLFYDHEVDAGTIQREKRREELGMEESLMD
jgi:hypothetical protein